jgi:hypothetical protein
MRALARGEYWVGVRANHIDLGQPHSGAVPIPVAVELAEISGSETYIHARHAEMTLIACVEGVHSYSLGEIVHFYLDPSRLFVFSEAGKLVAVPDDVAGDRSAGCWRRSNSRALRIATFGCRRGPRTTPCNAWI